VLTGLVLVPAPPALRFGPVLRPMEILPGQAVPRLELVEPRGFGPELWWKGDHIRGTISQANELQLLVNQEARAATGYFRTTNLGVQSMESGIRPAMAQLEIRQWRFGLRPLSLPQGDQARVVVGAPTAIGRRLTNALADAGRTESTVLLEEPETLDAELLQEEEAEAKAEAEKKRLGLVMFTDGSWLDKRSH